MQAAVRGSVLMTENDAADFLGVAKQTLSVWRCTGRYALPYVKLGRSIRYRLSDLEAFLAARTVTSTGEAESL